MHTHTHTENIYKRNDWCGGGWEVERAQSTTEKKKLVVNTIIMCWWHRYCPIQYVNFKYGFMLSIKWVTQWWHMQAECALIAWHIHVEWRQWWWWQWQVVNLSGFFLLLFVSFSYYFMMHFYSIHRRPFSFNCSQKLLNVYNKYKSFFGSSTLCVYAHEMFLFSNKIIYTRKRKCYTFNFTIVFAMFPFVLQLPMLFFFFSSFNKTSKKKKDEVTIKRKKREIE